MGRVIKLGEEEFEEIPSEAVAASHIISDMYIKLGQPKDPFTPSGEKMMNIILAVWEDLYPLEARSWYADRKEYQNNEMTISEQVSKGTGRSLASYPYPVYMMMKKVFKGFNATERNNCIKMVKKWPQLRLANRV